MELVMRRYAIVKKVEFKVPYGGWASAVSTRKSTGYIYVDATSREVGFMLGSGTAPTADMVLYAMMADKDIHRMAKEYVYETIRENPFCISRKIGQSDCEDYFLEIYKHFGDVNVRVCRKHLLHISSCYKINENIKPMWIGDFVELFSKVIEPEKPFLRKQVKAKLRSGFKFNYLYEPPRTEDITTGRTNIFE